jgi:predicted metal-dependent hydrolase
VSPARGDLPFLGGYPEATLEQVRALIAQGRLDDYLRRRYPEAHDVRSDGALYDYAMALKQRHLRNAPPLARVAYDNRLQVDQRALGTLTAVSRVQGAQLKAKREIRVASVFRDAPALMLRMIVVHELAHLKERAHDKAFYALCEHMLPDYHQVEFDTRLHLTLRAIADRARRDAAAAPPAGEAAPGDGAPR